MINIITENNEEREFEHVQKIRQKTAGAIFFIQTFQMTKRKSVNELKQISDDHEHKRKQERDEFIQFMIHFDHIEIY